jgi:uncharacterized protein YaiI (UPF0178 family)
MTTTIDWTSAQGALDRELIRLESLRTLRDAVQIAGGLQQTADESGKRLEAAQAAEAEAQADLEKIQQQVDAARSAADLEIAKASAAGDVVLTQAKVAASAIIAGAKAEAAKIISDAEIQTADARKRAQVLSAAIAQAGS